MSGVAQSEPVAGSAAITAALISTLAVLGIVFDWSAEISAAVDAAVIAWVAAIAWVVRSRVSPTGGN